MNKITIAILGMALLATTTTYAQPRTDFCAIQMTSKSPKVGSFKAVFAYWEHGLLGGTVTLLDPNSVWEGAGYGLVISGPNTEKMDIYAFADGRRLDMSFGLTGEGWEGEASEPGTVVGHGIRSGTHTISVVIGRKGKTPPTLAEATRCASSAVDWVVVSMRIKVFKEKP